MPEKSGDAAQAKLPSSTREVLQQHIAELGACSPATLTALCGEQLQKLTNVNEGADVGNARYALVGILRALVAAGTRAGDDDEGEGELFAHVHYCHVCGLELGRVDAGGCHCFEET